MKIDKLLLARCAALCAVASTTASPAFATEDKVIDVYPSVGKAGQTEYPSPTIEVEGIGRGKYGKVKTRELWAWITVRGRAPENAEKYEYSLLEVGRTRDRIDRPGNPTNTRFAFAYVAPHSEGGTHRLDPVTLCNEQARKGDEAARKKFVNKGGEIRLKNAYPIVGTSWWEIRKVGYNGPARDWVSESKIDAVVRCLPTGRFAANSSSTSTRGGDPSDVPHSAPDRSPTRTNPVIIKNVDLKLSHMNVQRVGNWMCPTQLRLYGRIDVNSAFRGDSIFVGPQWLSSKTRLEFTRAGGRTIVEVYPINWARTSTGSLSSGGNAPLKQSINIRFNIADRDGDLVKSAQKSVQITCRKPAPGAGGNGPDEVSG